jgi:hypothetical protein
MDFQLFAIPTSAGEAPFRNAGLRFRIYKMLSIPVMDVGQSFKTCSQCFAYIVLTLKTGAIRFTPLRHLQNAIIRKEAHDPIQIVRVKRITYLYQLGSNIHLRALPDLSRMPCFGRLMPQL